MNFLVSVIMPVYNAEKFLRDAVESAVNLTETGEIILIEDRSPDNALQVCKELAKQYDKVKVFQHPNGENRGAGASRNLGIEKAQHAFVSFLDADDLYTAHRFKTSKTVLEQDSSIDGVYEAVGIFKNDKADYKLYTVNKPIPPDRLFYYLLRGTFGHFHTNGITVKKSLLEKAGFFNTELKLHQDADLWLKLAYHGRIGAGNLTEPVAFVRKHENNRITHANTKSKLLYWSSVRSYFADRPIGWVNSLLINRKVARIKAAENNASFLVEFTRQLLR